MQHTLVIRMGAAHWDATLLTTGDRFDFRKMDRDARRKWYGVFMSSVRKMYRKAAPGPAAYLRGPHDADYKRDRKGRGR